MRPSLLPGLAVAAQRNRDRSLPDPALFEVGQAYRGTRPEDQWNAAAGLRADTCKPSGSGRHWSGTSPAVDLYDAKADVLSVLAALGFDPGAVQVAREVPDWFHPGRAGTLNLGPKRLGAFGELHPGVLAALDVSGPVAAFELDLDALPGRRRGDRTKAGLTAADLQPVRRDFAFVLDEDVAAGNVLRAVQGADKALISDVNLFDIFTGAGLPKGKKSLAVEVTLQPRQATLTEAQIDATARKIVAAVQKATGGELRG